MIAGIMEWDMKPRAEGVIPPEAKITVLDNTTFIIDGHYWGIPKGVPQNEVEVILDLMKFMRRVDQQVLTYKAFIGPSIKAATLDKAPAEIRDYVKEFWRPEYDQIGPGKKYKMASQLDFKELDIRHGTVGSGGRSAADQEAVGLSASALRRRVLIQAPPFYCRATRAYERDN